MLSKLPANIQQNIEQLTGRTWLLPLVIDWYEGSQERILLVTGGPGTGKSMIMAWLAGHGPLPEDATARERLWQIRAKVKAAHFCIAASGETAPRALAQNLAQQLTRNVPGFADALTASLAELVRIEGVAKAGTAMAGAALTGVQIGTLNLAGLGEELSFNRTLREPLQKLYENGYDKPLLLLVDALDEALTYTGTIDIVRLLAKLDDLPAQVRILVTSRPDERVFYLLPRARMLYLDRDAPPDQKPGQDDVCRYVQKRLKALAPELNEERRKALAERISVAAKGIFLYAHLLLADLEKGVRQIADLETAQLPQDLPGLYQEFLNRELGADRRAWRKAFRPVLGLIAVAQGEGLSATQLEELTGEDVDVEEALEVCRQYLEGELFEGPFRVFHRSFADFLLREPKNKAYRVDAADMHSRIADHYWKAHHADWQGCDEYGLNFLAIHLYHGGRGELLYELITPEWRRMKLERLYSDQSFVGDVELALDVVRHETSDRLPRFVGLCMMAGTIATKSNDVIPEALGAMMALDQEDRALAYVHTITDAGVRSGAFLQMARASWEEGNSDRARAYCNAALKDGQRESVRTIYGNPEPLFKDLIRWGYIDEAAQINDLLHTRMPSIMNSRLADSQQMLAKHICITHPSRVGELRERYPDTFGRLVAANGAIDSDLRPPADKGLADEGLQEFEPDEYILADIHLPAIKALARAREQLAEGNIAAAQVELDVAEKVGADHAWILAGVGSVSIGSEPWWPAIPLRARIGPLHRLEEVVDEIEMELDALYPAAWGGQMAYSAALGEASIQLTRDGRRDDAERMLQRLMRYCESLSAMEPGVGGVDVLKGWVAVLLALVYDLSQESKKVWDSQYLGAGLESVPPTVTLADLAMVWWVNLAVVDRVLPTITPSDLARKWLTDLQTRGVDPSDIAPTGSREEIRLGASLARYTAESLADGTMEMPTARQHLEIALEWVCSGQWEPTRWWGERTEGVRLIGDALLELASADRDWAETYLMRYFDRARLNGRHACWLHFLHALATLHLLDPDSLRQTWIRVEVVEDWVLSGRLRYARNLHRLGLRAEDAGEPDKAGRLFRKSLQVLERSEPGLAETVRQSLARVSHDR